MSEYIKTRAKFHILNEVLSFPTIRNKDWTSDSFQERLPQKGDLVALSSAPPSKWYLSWLRDLAEENGMPKYLLESIEDGELCWWSNVGISFYNRERVANNPQWQWSDAQFAFRDRWGKVARKTGNRMVVPAEPVFGGDGGVTLNVRIRFGISDYSNPKTFPNWKKVSVKIMDAYYKSSIAEYDSQLPQREEEEPKCK